MRRLVVMTAALAAAVPAVAEAAPPPPQPPSAESRTAARTHPRDSAAGGAVTVYAWREDGLYQIRAAVGRVTDIVLEPGERLVGEGPVAAGDTARWIIGDTESGTGEARRVHVLVKPTEPGLATNMIVLTDRRTYRLELRATAGPYMAAVSWRYPAGELVAVKGRPTPSAPSSPPPPPAAEDFDAARLSFAWRIEGQAPFRPVRVFDDGRQVFIDLPNRLGAAETPPFFLLSAEGRPELVNYRVIGRRYVVDRLFERGELRLGSGRGAQRVRILRGVGP